MKNFIAKTLFLTLLMTLAYYAQPLAAQTEETAENLPAPQADTNDGAQDARPQAPAPVGAAQDDASQDDASQAAAISETVRDALLKNAAGLERITLAWQKSRSSELGLKKVIETTGCTYDYGFLDKSSAVLMMQGDLIYLCTQIKNVLKGDPSSSNELVSAIEADEKHMELAYSISERAFDGERFFFGAGAEEEKEEGVIDPARLIAFPIENLKEDKHAYLEQEYTAFIGYKCPIYTNEIGESIKSYVLYLIEQGEVLETKETEQGENKVYTIKIKTADSAFKQDLIYEFTLASEFGYAVTSCVKTTLSGKIVQDIKNSNFAVVSKKEGIYIPQKTTAVYYSYVTMNGKVLDEPLFQEDYVLTEFSTKKIAHKQFELDKKYDSSETLAAEKTVTDPETGLTRIVPQDPDEWDRALEAAAQRSDLSSTSKSLAIAIKWAALALGILMIAFACFKKFVRK